MKKSFWIAALLLAFAQLSGQTYQITFSGSGLSSTVQTVTVWNLTQDTMLTMAGMDTLSLINTSGISTEKEEGFGLSIYPNPADKSGKIVFHQPIAGRVMLDVMDMTGKLILRSDESLPQGTHTYTVNGFKPGLYWIHVQMEGQQYARKLVFTGMNEGQPTLEYAGGNQLVNPVQGKLSGTKNLIQISYNPGEILMFKGVSGNYSRIVTLVPTQSQTVDFEFVACTDGSNNHYTVVTIGTQTWMAENLRTIKYRNGTTIPKVVDDNTWITFTTAAYCWYGNDSNAHGTTYGALYKWYAVSTGDLCPTGWHAPTQAEYTTLRNFLGGDSLAGSKMKETGTLHWDSLNTDATNESGFTARPGGLRIFSSGIFADMGFHGYWWSATGYSSAYAYCYGLDYDNGKLHAVGNNKGSGFSVRCVKD